MHFSDGANNLTAEIENHIFEKHSDHSFILDDEDAATWLLIHAVLPS
jgi:hypothetical protein